jgi:hypothetical protein
MGSEALRFNFLPRYGSHEKNIAFNELAKKRYIALIKCFDTNKNLLVSVKTKARKMTNSQNRPNEQSGKTCARAIATSGRVVTSGKCSK